jgi:hypothetical protein
VLRKFEYGIAVTARSLTGVRFVVALFFGLGLVLFARGALAAGEDAAVRDAVRQTMTEEYPGNLGPAKKKLQDQLALCLRKGCTAQVKAEVYVAIGMVESQLGHGEDALQNFKNALAADPDAKLPTSGVTPSIRAQWEEAAGKSDNAMPVPAGGVAAAIKLIQEALQADQEGRLDVCIEKDKAALQIEEMPRTRLHLASCESRSGKLVDALKNAQKALEVGIQKRDTGVMKVARVRVKELLDRIPHVTFQPPAGVTDLQVRFDERPVPTESLTKRFSIDPGKHTVVAEGTVNGLPSAFEQELDVKEKDLVRVRITLKPQASGFMTQGQIKCLIEAKNQEDVDACFPQNRKPLVIRLGADLSGYIDTNAVGVYTPAVNASVVSPTAGWNVGGNFLVDAVSAASPDIVASASPPFREYRYAGGVTGGYKPGLYGAQGSASFSHSPDYFSYTGGLRLSADLNEKLITPVVGYSYSHDRIGRGPNNWLDNFNPLKGKLDTHEFEAGVTFVLSPTSVLVVGGTLSIERGDQSQPYRYVAMFDPVDVAPFVPRGLIIDTVNNTRLPVKPLEQLPTERDRYAIGGRLNKRFDNATLRLDQRFYIDTWGIKASSTDGRYMVDLNRRFRVWPHLRLHMQTAANFYQLAYSAILSDPRYGTVIPTYRTGDRELSPLFTVTAGGGARINLGESEGELRYGIVFVADVMYTRYLKSLYVTARTAIYGSVGFDVEF